MESVIFPSFSTKYLPSQNVVPFPKRVIPYTGQVPKHIPLSNVMLMDSSGKETGPADMGIILIPIITMTDNVAENCFIQVKTL